MKKWKRPVIFWTLAILFLVTAPVIVLNARGYRFDMGRGVFVYSGTITFKSNPQDVNVYLNGKLHESKKLNRINNSFNISGLLPSHYEIRISADGFQDWHKKTDVHSGLANEFWNVLLVRKNYEETDGDTPGIRNFFIYSDGSRIAYTRELANGLGVEIFDAQKEERGSSFTFPSWQFSGEERKENIEWSPEGDYLSVPAKSIGISKDSNLALSSQKTGSLYSYFIIDLENKKSFNLNEFLGMDNISNIRWDSQKKGYLIFLSGNNLYRANISDTASISQISSDVSSFDVSGNDIFFSRMENNLIFKTDSRGKSDFFQVTNSFPEENDSGIFRIVVYDEDRIAIIMKNEDFYIYNKSETDTYFRKLGENIQGARFSDDGKKMLFWSDNEISVYYLRDKISQPAQNENSRQNITRYSQPIKNVQWFSDYEHVIFTTQYWTKIVELDPRDYRNCMDIVSTETENLPVIYDRNLEKLYFVDSSKNSTSLFSISFPEKITFLQTVGL